MHRFILILFLFAVPLSEAATELTLKNLEGQTESLNSYRGKIVVLNFWATWCVPCREEMPLFVQLQKKYEASGVQWIAVSTDAPEDLEKVEKFAEDFRLNFPVWIGGTTEQQISFELGTGIPATAILNREGELIFRIIGASSRKDLEKRISYLLSDENLPRPESLVLPRGITREHFEQHHARVTDEHHDHHEEEGGSEVPS